jgi:hypothetical protein
MNKKAPGTLPGAFLFASFLTPALWSDLSLFYR